MGWKCGLHADWTELTECVDDYLNSKEGTKYAFKIISVSPKFIVINDTSKQPLTNS